MSTDDLRALLGEWKALEAAATPGPWEADGGEIGQHWSLPEPWQKVVNSDVSCMSYCYGGTSAGVERVADAAFIALSRTLVPRLIAAVEAVLALHRPGDGASQGFTVHGYGYVEPYCDGCEASDEYAVEYPCPTVTALHAALIGDDDD